MTGTETCMQPSWRRPKSIELSERIATGRSGPWPRSISAWPMAALFAAAPA